MENEREREISPLMIGVAHDSFFEAKGKRASYKDLVEVFDEWFPYGWFIMLPITPEDDSEIITRKRVDRTTLLNFKEE